MINWPLVCIYLRKHYKAIATFAPEVNSSAQYLNKLARGELKKGPPFELGVRLLDLLYDHYPEGLQEVKYEN